MQIEHTPYWKKKRLKRSDITDDMIEYCILNSNKLKDKTWEKMFGTLLLEYRLQEDY